MYTFGVSYFGRYAEMKYHCVYGQRKDRRRYGEVWGIVLRERHGPCGGKAFNGVCLLDGYACVAGSGQKDI